jgi:putative membrane protein
MPMWGYGYGWAAFIGSVLWGLFWIGLLILLIWAIVRWVNSRGAGPFQPWMGQPPAGPSALEELRRRYARGEIDATTFDQMRERLEASYRPKEPPITATS